MTFYLNAKDLKSGLELGATSVTWRYAVWKQDGALAAEATIVTVALDMDSFTKRPLPEWLREKLAAYGAALTVVGSG